jgi:flagellar assembly protein FliH
MTNSSEPRRLPLPPRPDTRRFIPATRLEDGLSPAARADRFIPREEIGHVERWSMPVLSAQGAGPSAGQPLRRTLTTRQPSTTPEQWQSRVDAAREEGLQKGHRQGYEEGYRDGLSALEGFKKRHAEELGQRFAALIDALGEQLQAVEHQAAAAVAASAVQLAGQVLRQALKSEPEQVAVVAREAVNAVMLSASRIAVRVNPEDHAIVAQGAAEVLQARGARLVVDPSIQRGGCLVDTDVGSVDATLEARWARASAAMGHPMPLPGAAPDPDAVHAGDEAAMTESARP